MDKNSFRKSYAHTHIKLETERAGGIEIARRDVAGLIARWTAAPAAYVVVILPAAVFTRMS